MYRVLVVEDIPDVQEGMIAALVEIYQEWTVDAASSVSEAMKMIDQSVEEDLPYDVAILDFHLPEQVGHNPQPSLHLTRYALEKLPEALVIEITAFAGDPLLQKDLLNPNLQDPDRRMVFIPKRKGAPLEVADLAVQRVLGDPIEEQMNDMFGPEQSVHSGRRSRSANTDSGLSLTHRLADLRGRIVHSWEHLSPELQARIRKKFKVDHTASPVRITMF